MVISNNWAYQKRDGKTW